MTAKEYAKQLVNDCYQPLVYLKCGVSSAEMWSYAKSRALASVNLRLNAYLNIPVGSISWAEKQESFFQDIKTEIERL